MSDEVNGSNGAPAAADNVGQGSDVATVADNVEQQASDNSVKYDTYRKVVNHNKNLQAKFEESEAARVKLEQDRLAADGKKDELIASLQEQVEGLKQDFTNKIGGYAYKSVSDQVKAEANKLGCVNADALTKLVDLNAVDFDKETFVADSAQVKALTEQAKQEHPYLFQKAAPKFDASTPGGQPVSATPDLENMTAEEIHKFMVRNFKEI